MTFTEIATFVTSLSALGGTLYILYKARYERKKTSADTESVNVATIKELSEQLSNAYKQIDKLRDDINSFAEFRDELACRRDYEEYLLRGIARLTASLAANELSVPWIPLSYDGFIKRENDKKNKEA